MIFLKKLAAQSTHAKFTPEELIGRLMTAITPGNMF